MKHFREAGEPGSRDRTGHDPNKRAAADSARNAIGRISPEDLAAWLEPSLRTWVRESVEEGISKVFGPGTSSRSGCSGYPIRTSQEVAGYELRFVNSLPGTVFTGSRIGSEDESPILIELIDSRTNTRVTTGPLSSAKVSILVLDGDFDSDKGEGWSEAEFNSNIVRERQGRRPLITGELTVNLREGLGCCSNITITDNSKWIRSGRFRLGARILLKVPIQARVMEAASRSFVVKDHRGEGYRKHHPPHLKDAVWRLEKIAKDRIFHSRLASQGICTVEDFLRLLETNPSLLRTIIVGSGAGIANKTWQAIVEHASTCVMDDSQTFIYSQDSTNEGILLDSVYRVVKVTFDGRTYIPVNELNPHQKALMQNLKRQAYANIDRLKPVSATFMLGPPQPAITPQPDAFLAPQEYLQIPPFQGFGPLSDSTLYSSEGLGSQQSEVLGPQKYQPDQIFSPTSANSFMASDIWPGDYNGGISFPGSSERTAMFSGGNVSHIQISTCCPPTSVWTPGDGFFMGSSSDRAGEGGTFPSLPNFGLIVGSSTAASPHFSVHIRGTNRRSRAAWSKIRAAFKFRSMRKVAAQKRLNGLLYAM